MYGVYRPKHTAVRPANAYLNTMPYRHLGEDVYVQEFLMSALHGIDWTASDFGRLTLWGKNPHYPLYNQLGGSQNRSERIGIEKNPLSQPGIKP